MPFANVNGVRLFYDQQGTGPDLVLIGGLTANHLVWKTILPMLIENFRVTSFDNRGAGQSDVPSSLFSIADMAQDVVGLLDHLRISQAHVYGHSMGGAILQQLLIDFPERINKAIIASSSPFSPAKAIWCFRTRVKLMEACLGQDVLIETLLPWMFGNAYLQDDDRVAATIAMMLNNPYPQSEAGFYGQLSAMGRFNSKGHLSRITNETMIIAGDEDILIPASYSELIHREILSSSFVVMKNTGHMAHVEFPDEVVKLIEEFT